MTKQRPIKRRSAADAPAVDESVPEPVIAYVIAETSAGRIPSRVAGVIDDQADALTGLLGNIAFRAELARKAEAGEPFSLIFLDLDSFKAVNGLALARQGDRMLQRTSQALTVLSPAPRTVFRYGGDEFVVLLPIATAEEAVDLGERICAAVAAIEVPESDDPFFPAPAHLSCSVGVARYPTDGRVARDLIDAADRATYEAKRVGGGRVALASDG